MPSRYYAPYNQNSPYQTVDRKQSIKALMSGTPTSQVIMSGQGPIPPGQRTPMLRDLDRWPTRRSGPPMQEVSPWATKTPKKKKKEKEKATKDEPKEPNA